MQRWIFYDYMGSYNPVCEDVGEITGIKPNWPQAQYSYGLIDTITADGIMYGCDVKRAVLEIGGICPLYPYDPKRKVGKEERRLPDGIRHGDAMETGPGIMWVDGKGSILTHICIDPRVLYIAHRGWQLLDKEDGPTDADIRRWQADMPTRQTALHWLLENKKKIDCIPFDCMLRIIQKQEAR